MRRINWCRVAASQHLAIQAQRPKTSNQKPSNQKLQILSQWCRIGCNPEKDGALFNNK